MATPAESLYMSPSPTFVPILSVDDVHRGSDGVYRIGDETTFVCFGYLHGATHPLLVSLFYFFLCVGDGGSTETEFAFGRMIRFLRALENKVPLDDDAPFVSWVVPGDSPRILVYVEFTALAVYAPWGEGPHGLLSPRVVTSQASLLKEVAQHLVEMRLELRYCNDFCLGIKNVYHTGIVGTTSGQLVHPLLVLILDVMSSCGLRGRPTESSKHAGYFWCIFPIRSPSYRLVNNFVVCLASCIKPTMEIDLATVVDGEFDYDLMGKALDAYDDALTPSQRWSRIHDGTHLYYRYMARLIELANKPKSLLCASFDARRDIVLAHTGVSAASSPIPFSFAERMESALLRAAELPLWLWDPDSQSRTSSDVCPPVVLARSGGSGVLSPPSFVERMKPSTLRATELPTEIWDSVLSRLEYDVQLLSRGVCTWWCNILTPRTHAYLVLSLPDCWTDIIPHEEPEEVVTFLRVFAMETEIDVSATIVKRGSCCSWRPFSKLACLSLQFLPPFVSGGGDGRLRGSCVVDLSLIRVSLERYSIEGMLSPDGCLRRLYIDSIQEGGLYLPASLSSSERLRVRDSLAFNSFRRSSLSEPPAPSLKYLKLDILRDPYGIQVTHQRPQLSLTGGFALVHQLFQSELGRLQYGLFVRDSETFPLQTRVSCLEELDMCIGTQYYGDASLLWPGMSQSLTTLTVRIREPPVSLSPLEYGVHCGPVAEHHSGGSVSNINLNGLAALSTLNVFSVYRGMYGCMQMISSWASSRKELPTSLLNLNLEVTDFSRIHLGEIMGFDYMRRKLDGDVRNNGLAFRGTFTLALRSPQWIVDDRDYDDGVSLAAALLSDTTLGLHHAECVRYHRDTLVV
ncbi:hypothetical protein EDD18DRAFT_1369516 [Armillaria luteobubalina]|uniref:F-box domain-containing protein n=1 Tax=Armillaria luteobubalina TaxID=153913 RepID=A0AA39NW08_9AGAR|nr:hypothetical protein EDD18DRAFT_1369516 [Armillaria luteobubalina]